MVIRGRIRGNGRQLANYLLTMAENSEIQILDINGRGALQEEALRHALTSMSLTSELTKSQKGLYHAQINPAYGDDKNMTPADWEKAADMLGEALGLADQRRVIVLHTKKDRTHAHVVWERYDHQKGIMRSDSFSRYKQNAVRLQMEKQFEHKQTPEKNPHRADMKKELSALWQQSTTGAGFIKAAKELGYIIATSPNRRPFMVIDPHGRSFDLVRQLDKVQTKEVRERFKSEKLPTEKTALQSVATHRQMHKTQEGFLDKIAVQQENESLKQNDQRHNKAKEFAETKQDLQTDKQALYHEQAVAFNESKQKITNPNSLSKTEKAALEKAALEKLKKMRENKIQTKGNQLDR
ncbi:MAG: relaxase/mobilization nuclease domain-containing protein [Phycisphaerales bacterium]|nr:relaxase/mobilization nuclease domain-containing protein [Phycisphaerales bacterium]